MAFARSILVTTIFQEILLQKKKQTNKKPATEVISSSYFTYILLLLITYRIQYGRCLLDVLFQANWFCKIHALGKKG